MRTIIFLLCSFLALLAYARKEHTVSVSLEYIVPDNISLEEAKRIALEKVKLKAIEEKFGTSVSHSTMMVEENHNGRDNIHFSSFGGIDVKGEWVETISGPDYDLSFHNGTTLLTVTLKGKIRESNFNQTIIEAIPLRNGCELKNEAYEYKNGNDLYLYFKSPIGGFLTVYLTDSENAYCLLPYKGQGESIFPIKGNEEYILFNKRKDQYMATELIDEYVMTAEGEPESNIIYVIFSPEKFNKTIDNDKGRYIPRQLILAEFHKWMEKQIRRLDNISIKKIPIRILP